MPVPDRSCLGTHETFDGSSSSMLFGYAGRSGGSLRYEKGMAARPELKGAQGIRVVCEHVSIYLYTAL